MLIAIDGPAGAGKSTVARALARALGFTYLNSGAMYRCIALRSLDSPDAALGALAQAATIEFGSAPGDERVVLDGRDVTAEIRSPEISEVASRVAADAQVRHALVARQRELIAWGDWVVEGRDIGTVVVPGAEVKVFITASPQERARRRAQELGVDPDSVLAEQRLRDERDRGRQHSPLAPAPDAMTLDTTGLDVEEVVERIAMLARSAGHTGLHGA